MSDFYPSITVQVNGLEVLNIPTYQSTEVLKRELVEAVTRLHIITNSGSTAYDRWLRLSGDLGKHIDYVTITKQINRIALMSDCGLKPDSFDRMIDNPLDYCTIIGVNDDADLITDLINNESYTVEDIAYIGCGLHAHGYDFEAWYTIKSPVRGCDLDQGTPFDENDTDNHIVNQINESWSSGPCGSEHIALIVAFVLPTLSLENEEGDNDPVPFLTRITDLKTLKYTSGNTYTLGQAGNGSWYAYA